MGHFEFPIHLMASRSSRIWQDKVGVSALRVILEKVGDKACLGLSFSENF